MPAFNRPGRGVLVTAVMVRGAKQVQSIGGGHTPDTAFYGVYRRIAIYFSPAVSTAGDRSPRGPDGPGRDAAAGARVNSYSNPMA